MILNLSQLISRAIEKSLEDKVAVSFSGGLDSTVIATIARKHSEVELFSAGVEESADLDCSEKVARELTLPLNKIIIDTAKAMGTYGRCHALFPLDLLKLELLVPIYCVAEAASKKGHKVILFGAGAEELFVGYERYYLYKEEGKNLESILKEEFRTLPHRDIGRIKRVCREFDIEARFPFYDQDIAKMMFSVPLEERMEDRELKKGILREAAKMLGTPEMAIKRRKKALQYGSGIHKMLIKNSDEINRSFAEA